MGRKNVTDGWIRGLAARLPDGWLGRADEMERRYRSAYISGSPRTLILEAKTRTLRRYALLSGLLLCVSAAMVVSGGRGDLSDISRDEYGGDARTVSAEVEAVYGDEKVKRNVSVRVLPKEVEPGAVAREMESLKKGLPSRILGGNASLNDIVSDLDLPAEDEATGIDIAWESDRLDLVDAWGRVNLIEGTAGEEVTLTANLRKGEVWDKVSFRVILGSPGAGYDYARGLEDSLTAVTERVSASAEGEALSFPSVTDSGIRLAWRAPGNYGYPALALVLIAIGFAVYRGRYARVDETVRRWREGIRRDFPGFLNKLLLLLNAGLVLTSAVERIADDYADHRREGEERCFYEELCGMKNRMRASNTTLAMEFADMATRSGQREVLRFSTILADNIDRGSALADKLAQESEMLWRIRTKDAEEKGRLAETKLTFPMALQLLVIILITVAPAVMDMR